MIVTGPSLPRTNVVGVSVPATTHQRHIGSRSGATIIVPVHRRVVALLPVAGIVWHAGVDWGAGGVGGGGGGGGEGHPCWICLFARAGGEGVVVVEVTAVVAFLGHVAASGDAEGVKFGVELGLGLDE